MIRDRISDFDIISLSDDETEEFEEKPREWLRERYLDPIS
jgi:hypothetical protein